MPHRDPKVRRAYLRQWRETHKAQMNQQARAYYQQLRARGICRDCFGAVEDPKPGHRRAARCRPCRRTRSELRQHVWNERPVVERRLRKAMVNPSE